MKASFKEEMKRIDLLGGEKIKELCLHEKCVAVGEIGLDYHYGNENKDKQKACFIFI